MSRSNPDGELGPSGFLIVDKAAGWTSHDVVAKARGLLGTRKVGHSGTLDPGATGVLILGVGKGTRLLRFLTALPKTYEAEAVLGVETDTLDADGEVTKVHRHRPIDFADIVEVANRFVGEIEQVPPMVSAVKVGGKRLYELARQGKEVERKPRKVRIHELELFEVPAEPNVFRFVTRCSSGTYIRTIAADIATELGSGAHLRYLRRTAVGSFSHDVAAPIESAELIPLAEGLVDYRRVVVDHHIASRVRTGQRVDLPELEGDGPWALVDESHHLVSVHELVDDRPKSAVVIALD